MQAIAEFAMRSRAHAIGTSVVAGVLPLLGWLSLVIVALVCLRHGAMAGSLVLIWTLLPFALPAVYFGQPAVLSLIGVFLLAGLLRTTRSWEVVLMATVIYSAVSGFFFEFVMLDKFLAVFADYVEQANLQIAVEDSELRAVLPSAFVIFLAYGTAAMLILARWCQAALYNPGGFKQEFHQLRLSPIVGGILLVALVACFGLQEMLGSWIPLLAVPLVIAALGFVHWLIASRDLSTSWVVGFYCTLLLFGQFVYPFLISLGLMDSALNLRTRLQPIQKD